MSLEVGILGVKGLGFQVSLHLTKELYLLLDLALGFVSSIFELLELFAFQLEFR